MIRVAEISRSLSSKAILTVFAFAFTAISVKAQWPSELWHEGQIVLAKGDTLKGMVKYDMQQNLVQFSATDGVAEAFTAKKVFYFEIFDSTVKQYRRFFTLPYAARSEYRTPVFFELLEEGKMTLLAREVLEYRNTNSYPFGTLTRLVLIYNFFFLDEKGVVEEFKGNKNDLLDMMGKKSDAVEKFIRSNNLRFDDKHDLTQIVDYYNSLFGS